MSDFAVKVVKIVDPVEDHPNADRLSLVRVNGYVCIANKLDDGSPRYKQGDLVVYVPEGAVVPDYLLKPGFWNEEKGIGLLAGAKGNRVKAMKLRDIFSQGILFAVESSIINTISNETHVIEVKDGDDVAEFLGITKYVPPIPTALAGEVCNIHGKTARYDFESIQSVPDLFTVGEEVVVTEKLHGTNFQVGYVPGLDHEELFFDGNLYVASKGLGGEGLVFKDNEKNATNSYVLALKKLLNEGFGEKIKAVSELRGQPVRIFAELYGAGIQKGFSYGMKEHSVATFDIQVGWNFIPYDEMIDFAEKLGLATVPLLYRGPFDLDTLVEHRDGKTTVFTKDAHIREGIVIKAADGGRHPNHGRKIGKWVSPNYLLKSTGEEFN